MTTPTPAQQLRAFIEQREKMHHPEIVTAANGVDLTLPTLRRALAALEAVEKMKRELPHRVESVAFGDLNAEELSIFDNGYNAALLLCHNLLAASGLNNGGGDDVDANFGARLVAAPPADAVEVSRG